MDDAALHTADHEALLDFLYLCPHGLAEFDASGEVQMINPACARFLMPILPPNSSGIGNLLDALSPYAPDLRMRLAPGSEERGLILDGMRIYVGAVPAPRAARPRFGQPGRKSAAAPDPLVLALTVLRLSPDRHMAVVSDVSAQVSQERRLRDAEAWVAAVAEGAEGYAFFELDAEGRVADWNTSAERLFGLREVEVLGRPADGVIAAVPGVSTLLGRLAGARQGGWHVAEGWMPQTEEGRRFWGTSVVSVMRAGNDDAAMIPEPEAFLVVVRDDTGRREAAQDLRRALCQDHLTGVANRRRFFELGAEECAIAARTGQALSVLMIDADRFKAVNDSFGHSAGDAVLRALAGTLNAGARGGVDIVARLGGEEFAVLLPGLSATAAYDVAERLRVAIATSVVPILDRDGQSANITITASFGVAGFDSSESDLDSLLRAADRALYVAKAAGRNCVHVRCPNDDTAAVAA